MPRTSEEERNLELVLEVVENVLNRTDSDAVDRYMTPNYRQHSSMVADGPAGLKAFLAEGRKAYGRVEHDVKRAFVDGDHVCLHYHVRRFEGDDGFAVMDIFRVEGDRVAEHWDVIQPLVSNPPHSNGVF